MKTSKKAAKKIKAFEKMKTASIDRQALKQIKGGGLLDFIKGAGKK